MKYIYLSATVLIALALLFQSCEGMKDNFQEHVGQRNYSGRIDSLIAIPGFERVLLRWQNPTDQRSQSIKIVYGADNRVIEFDTLVEYASIEGLTDAAGREFTVFTRDRFGNLSIPISTVSFPVTRDFVSRLMIPPVTVQPAGAGHSVAFMGTTNSMMLFAGGVEYTITTPDGTVLSGDAELPEAVGAPMINVSVSELGLGLNYFPPGVYHIEYRVSVLPILAGMITEDVVWLENTANVTVHPLPDRVNLMQVPGTISGYPADHWTSAEDHRAAVDGDTYTKWQVRRGYGQLTWRLESPFAVTEYTITTARDHGHYRDPRDWTFQASNDGVEWTILHQVTDFGNHPRRHTVTFLLDNSTEFRYYRINFTRADTNGLQIGEWTLWFDRADFWANYWANQAN